ncbi:pyrroline-5-carboxylate reductase [Hyphomonas sp. L-53-1-40]|uniref:pyrroline-5-carboxylate reductase n=1 Tax=Hyphomonas sp. L-53-1-40 TaxID=1207058 RepID=UPI0005508A88|nr:pyrroline-5-carboxylate reductase [Hyphomonas sp. L-53-1-40]
MKVLLVGCGKMGGALLTQWMRAVEDEFTIIDPFLDQPVEGARLFKDINALGDEKFDLLIVAIKPQMVDEILPAYKDVLNPDGAVASIAAGCSVQRLQTALAGYPIIRIMPNLPSAIGAGVAGLYASSAASAYQRDTVETLMQAAGTAVWVDDEDQIDRVTAVAGSGPGYVFEIARAYIEAAKELGFSDEQASDLVLGTLDGSIRMILETGDNPENLRNSVTSKNGTTEAGLKALNGDGKLSDLLKATTDAAYKRAIELR